MNLYVYSGYGPYLLLQATTPEEAVEIAQGVLSDMKLPREDIDAAHEMTKQLHLPDGPGVVVEWWG